MPNAPAPRIPYPASTASRDGLLHIERMLGHFPPDLLDGFSRFAGAVMTSPALDPLLRELAILRVGHLSRAAYELQQHNAYARHLGMAEAVLAGVAQGPDAPIFSDTQRAILRFVDDLVLNVRPSDANLEAVRALLPTDALFALVLTVGQYMLVCRFLETAGLPLEEDETLILSRLSGLKD